MSDSDPQRRHFVRIPFHTGYELQRPHDEQRWTGTVCDLSLHGVLIDIPEGFTTRRGEEFDISLLLNNGEVSIRMQARVAHHNERFIGFECEHIDIESMSHLRRLLELNLADAKEIEREIGEIIQLNTQQAPR